MSDTLGGVIDQLRWLYRHIFREGFLADDMSYQISQLERVQVEMEALRTRVTDLTAELHHVISDLPEGPHKEDNDV